MSRPKRKVVTQIKPQNPILTSIYLQVYKVYTYEKVCTGNTRILQFLKPRKIVVRWSIYFILSDIIYRLDNKDFQASGLGWVRSLTAATAANTLAPLFLEMLCYVLGRFHSSSVLSTRIGLHKIEVINKQRLLCRPEQFEAYFSTYKAP